MYGLCPKHLFLKT